MHYYHTGYLQAMSLPIQVFFLMNRMIPRIQAEQDIRGLAVATASQSSEGVEASRKHLLLEMDGIQESPDEPQPISAERDEAGFNELKMMA